jgi:trimeric autotransporter adhesin
MMKRTEKAACSDRPRVASCGVGAKGMRVSTTRRTQLVGGRLGRLRLVASSVAAFSTGILLVASLVAVWIPNRGYAAECTAAASSNGGDDGGTPSNTACGENAQAASVQSTAIGTGSKAVDRLTTAVGAGASAEGLASTAVGVFATAIGEESAAVGNSAIATGQFSSAFGRIAHATDTGASAFGNGANARGVSASAYGDGAQAIGAVASAYGAGAQAIGGAASAYGAVATARDINASAFGSNAVAAKAASTAVGAHAHAEAQLSTAIGALASAEADGSTAIGTGAKATKADQIAIGTKDNTYTTPGITSDLSRSRQSGPLEVVTSDAAGNLASDGGFIFKQLKEAREGIAIAMALHDPDLVAGEKFGVRLNWGNFEGNNALALTAAGVIGTDVLTSGDRLAVSGGVGYGVDQNTVGARVGVQMTWK